METNAWVVFVDIYGFKEMIAKAEIIKAVPNLVDSVGQLWKEVQMGIEESFVKPTIFRFSDSAFLIYPVENAESEKSSKLEAVIEQMGAIMNTFVTAKYPLRGGMAYGKVFYDSFLVAGEPVIMAYTYEQMVPAPLILLPAKEVMADRAKPTIPHGIEFRKYRLKNNMTVNCHLIHPSPESAYRNYIEEQIFNTSLKGPYDLATKWICAKEYLQTNAREVSE